jgi:DNA-binding NarL/FixJ family response regulator
VRVVIAEDQTLLREGLGRLFEDAGHEVIASVEDAERLRAAVGRAEPDLAVVDVRMPPSFTDEGMQAARWLREVHPSVGVLVLSQHVEAAGAVGLVSQGGFGYLLKDRVLNVADFLEAAERVARGARRLTRRSSRRSCGGSPRTASRSSRRASARCSPSWRRGSPTSPSRAA